MEGCVSEWRAVISGVPQGSVLGPLLIVIYINDLNENVTGLISKFADDTNVSGFVDSDEDHQRIQQDIDRLEAWVERWQMALKPDKCEVMHFGMSNTDWKCTVNFRTFKSIDRQRALGVQVHRSLKVGTHVEKGVKKAYGMLAFIGRGISKLASHVAVL